MHLPPLGEARAYALFAHCFTCSKDLRAARHISRALAERGIGSLRFDFTGLGESEGDFADTNFSSNIDDLVAAADFMRQRAQAPALLVGHSLGGAAVLAAAHRIDECTAVATIGAPHDAEHVRQLLDDEADTIVAEGEACVSVAGRSFRIKKQLLDDLAEQQVDRRIATLKRALLVLHSPTDNIVGIDNARLIFQEARHPKSFVSLDGADHLLSRERDARYVAEVLASWASRYLPEPTQVESAEPRRVRVAGGSDGFRQRVTVGPHASWADEPEALGGSDAGPNPYELLLAGLGACTSMTLTMYAKRKGWPLDEVEVLLSHAKIHASDCEECETKQGKLDRIERGIRLRGALDDEQRERLMQIADKCPVHRTLQSEVQVVSRTLQSEVQVVSRALATEDD
jgi:putative redox protein